MQTLDADATREALPWTPLIDALAEGFRREIRAPLRHHHTLENANADDDDTLLLMPAWDEDAGGVKIVNVHPGNAARGVPTIASSYLLFDRTTGVHRLVLDGGELTARRTAAASALAASFLARSNSHHLLLVGSGRVAANLPGAYRAVRPIERVSVWSRESAHAESLVRSLRKDGFEAAPVRMLEAAVPEADVVSCATLARDPLVAGEWLRPGQHLDLIGGFTPAMRETDDTAIRRASVFIDTDHAKAESGDIRTPLESGVLDEAAIRGSLASLCRGAHAGRASDREITLFKSVGSAVEDLAAAMLAATTLAASD